MYMWFLLSPEKFATKKLSKVDTKKLSSQSILQIRPMSHNITYTLTTLNRLNKLRLVKQAAEF